MKQLLSIALAFCVSAVFAQKIKVSEGNENVNGGGHNVLQVTIPNATVDFVEKSWKNQIKKMGGKYSTKKGEMVADDASIKAMGDNTFDVYSKVKKEGDDAATLIVGVDLGGAYMSSSQHPDQFKYMKDYIYDWAIKCAKDIVGNELKEEEKALAKLEKEQEDLVKEKEKLEKDIEDYKKKIEQAEKDIEDNLKAQEGKKEEIGAQQKVVKDVEQKVKDIK